ncbi:MAG: hypothetical protein NC342_05550 [Pseudoflavonifractor sp.]|nr:hypothetical protein [Pseudoflavonifractor sp.]
MTRTSLLYKLWAAALLAVAALVVASCSLKKNTAASRRYTEFITRYNIYFNGDEHYKETLKKMETDYPDDYTRLLLVHPSDAYADEAFTRPSGDFTRSIEKAQKAIELRSIKKKPRIKGRSEKQKAFRAREEFNPFLHNAWLMMGRSQYMNGDFLGAATTFAYIAKHFGWLPQTVAEARLWEARCYAAQGWTFEAENNLRRVKPDDLTNSALRALYPLVKADIMLKSGRYDEAIEPLQEAARLAKGAQETRLTFLLGQVMARQGDKTGAYKAFEKIAKSSTVPYAARFNARIKQSEVYAGDNIEPEVKSLRSMLRYDRNKEYQDQIYYAIGNLYLSRRDTAKAIENYILAAEKSTRSGIDKALAQLQLGELYFDQRRYDLAQPRYSEAVPQLPTDYPNLKTIKRRSDVLDELAVYSGNVTLQDSLLRLSALSPEEQEKVAQRLVDELKKKEKEEAEEARRAEYEANASATNAANAANAAQGNAAAANSFMLNNDKSWYFYNTAVKNAGKTEFQKRWGSRRLEDDWRRRNKSSFSFSDFDTPSDSLVTDGETPDAEMPSDSPGEANNAETDSAAQAAQRAADPHFIEYYLAQIPKTDEERQVAHDVIQEGRYNMGLILKDKLEDFEAAPEQWGILLADYPDNIYRLDVYFNLYLMYMRLGNEAMAEKYRALILSDFAESEQGLALRDPNYIDNLREMNARQEAIYEGAYGAYLADDTAAVRSAAAMMADKYPMSPVMPKVMFLDALTHVTANDAEGFSAKLRSLLERYPQADVSPIASSYLKELARGRKLQSGSMGVKAMVWDMRLTNDTTLAYDPDAEIAFDIADEGEPLLILTYATDSVAPNELLYDVALHNFTTFKVKDYDLEQMNFGRLGLLIISGFDSFDELNHYRSTLLDREDVNVVPPQARPVVISRKNFELLMSKGRSFDDYFHAIEAARVAALEEEKGVPPESEQSEQSEQSDQSDQSDLSDQSDDPEEPQTIDNPIEDPDNEHTLGR